MAGHRSSPAPAIDRLRHPVGASPALGFIYLDTCLWLYAAAGRPTIDVCRPCGSGRRDAEAQACEGERVGWAV